MSHNMEATQIFFSTKLFIANLNANKILIIPNSKLEVIRMLRTPQYLLIRNHSEKRCGGLGEGTLRKEGWRLGGGDTQKRSVEAWGRGHSEKRGVNIFF